MGKLFALLAGIWQLAAKYPAMTAGVSNVVIIAGATVGLHLTTAELASIASAVAAVFAVLVHAGVIPVTKVSNVKAGVKPTVPSAVEVGEPLSATVPAAKPVAYAPTAPSPVLVSPAVSVATGPVSDPEMIAEAVTAAVKKSAPDASRLGNPITPIGKK